MKALAHAADVLLRGGVIAYPTEGVFGIALGVSTSFVFLFVLFGGEEMGLRKVPAEVVATISGAPQLMPHPAIPWLMDRRGDVIARDVFDLDTWRDMQWSIFDPTTFSRERIAYEGAPTVEGDGLTLAEAARAAGGGRVRRPGQHQHHRRGGCGEAAQQRQQDALVFARGIFASEKVE